MTGEVIESRPGGGGCAIALAVAGVLLAGLFVLVPDKSAWPITVLPFGAALGFWLGRPSPTRFRVEADGLDFGRPTDEVIRFADLEMVTTPAAAGPRNFPIQLNHAGGVAVLPPRLSVPSEELLAFLEGKVPRVRRRPVPPALHAYREEQIAKFGEDRVYTFVGRPKLATAAPSHAAAFGMVGFTAAAGVMAGRGFAPAGKDRAAWLVAGAGVGASDLRWNAASPSTSGARSRSAPAREPSRPRSGSDP